LFRYWDKKYIVFEYKYQPLPNTSSITITKMSTSDFDSMECPLSNPTVHITAHDATGKAVVHSSQNAPVTAFPDLKAILRTLYTTSSLPANLNNNNDIKQHQAVLGSGELGIVKANGTVCRYVDFAPGNSGMMHRTQSLDYGIVLEGNVLMELDDGTNTPLGPGDVAVQRATMHAWKNASETRWARMVFVLQDCEPVVVGGERFKEDLGAGVAIFPSSGNDGH
jgi:quercetin dioxygenase-like cupin family protein